MKTLLGLACCSLLLCLPGCGKPTVSGSCAAADHSQCTDYSERAADLPSNQAQCTGSGDTWSSAACTTTGTIGGCQQIEGITTQTTWYFGTTRTATEIQSACTASGQTFLAR